MFLVAEVFPFPAYSYNRDRVELEKVVTQPYDKITPEMQARYYALSPFNLIPVEKGRSDPADTAEDNVYTRAAHLLNDWIAQGILVRDPVPAFYVYFQEYAVPGSSRPSRRIRKGFIGLGRIEDYDAGVVFRHEQTLAAPKADRLELLRRTRTQTGLLFMLYSDPARAIDGLLDQVAQAQPSIEVRDEFGVRHQIWRVTDTPLVAELVRQMAGKKLIIADGHHRYETALAYRNECRAAGGVDLDAPHEKAMMAFFNTYAEGLTILPTHRLVKGLARFNFDQFRQQLSSVFDCYAYPFSSDAERASSYAEFRKDLTGINHHRRAIGVYASSLATSSAVEPMASASQAQAGNAFYLLVLRRDASLDHLLHDFSPAQRQLDVVLLHRLVLEKGLGITAQAVAGESHLAYEREMDAAVASVDSGQAQLAFLLNPVRVEQVTDIALRAEVLPQKSTDFYPKLLSALTLYRLDG
jgi:uncharacterized protein (DUF1015 family)